MDLESRDGITVAELIDMLAQHPADAVVELSIVAPVADGDDDITVDRYPIDGVMPWRDEDDASGPGTVWLVGGEDDDVEVFLDAIETDTDPHDHDHEHDGHDHDH
jgi:hypothetical protein